MCICIYAHGYIHSCVYTYVVCVYTHVCIYTHSGTHQHTCMFKHICIYVKWNTWAPGTHSEQIEAPRLCPNSSHHEACQPEAMVNSSVWNTIWRIPVSEEYILSVTPACICEGGGEGREGWGVWSEFVFFFFFYEVNAVIFTRNRLSLLKITSKCYSFSTGYNSPRPY